MFGWELPPFNSGGLGVACFELTKSLTALGAKVTFVLPKSQQIDLKFMKVMFANDGSAPAGTGHESIQPGTVEIQTIDTLLSPYVTEKSYQKVYKEFKGSEQFDTYVKKSGIYAPGLIGEVYRYAEEAAKIIKEADFNIIHAHDWLSFPAGVKAKELTGKPLVLHVHSTEYDRSGGGNVNPDIYAIEKFGLEQADRVICVSQFTKNKVIEHYHINPSKVEVVHNAITQYDVKTQAIESFRKAGKKIVLFVGRITIQKGPDYFVKAASMVLEKNKDVVFVIAGSGDMENQIIHEVAALGIGSNFIFAGFQRGDNLISLYQSADVCVMPSVSEPFGLVALESMSLSTPTIVSNQSGVSEVISHALKVNFWDVEDLADKILSVITHPALFTCLSEFGSQEAKAISWLKSASRCLQVYQLVLNEAK